METVINNLTPENNMVAYNFYAVSDLKENIYTCKRLILQYDNENISLPLSLKGNSVGYFRALWKDNTLVDANLERIGSWAIQHNPNSTILKIQDDGIPNNPNATTFLILTPLADMTYSIGTNTQGNLQNSENDFVSYQVQFYQPQNIISEQSKYNSLYVPFIATSKSEEQNDSPMVSAEQSQQQSQDQIVNVYC